MTKEEYSNYLKSPKWKYKRTKILIRDNYLCQKCGSRDKLHVHHLHYIEGNLPWEVPDNFLITLCSTCHDEEHREHPIYTFIIKSKKKDATKKSDVKKNPSKPKKKVKKLKGRDKKLQARYNKLKSEGKLPRK